MPLGRSIPLALAAFLLTAPAIAAGQPPAAAPAMLTIQTAAFATAVAPEGQYQARSDNVFMPGEEAHIYLAVRGFSSRPVTTGTRVEFQVGVQIANATGAIIARSNELDNLVRDTPTPPTDYFGDLAVTLPNLKSGSYTLGITLRDPLTGRSGSTTLPFSIMPRL
jgi:hypothetical protein